MTHERTANRYAVIGAGGQLGFDLVRAFALPGEVVPLGRADLDLLDAARTREVLRTLRPTHVLNTAAYNQVDRAEDDRAAAFALNAEAVGALAAAVQDFGATLVHFSTDYVFDGRKGSPYTEDDEPDPVNVYGESKLAGERLARARCERTFVFRVCGLFGVARSRGKGGTNFVETMLGLAAEGKSIRVVADQVLTPSGTFDLARKVWQVIPSEAYGIYHLTNAGQTSWYDFAREMFRLTDLRPDVTPVTTAEFGARARRPAFSVLAHRRLAALGLDDLRPWAEALAAYVAERGASASPSPR